MEEVVANLNGKTYRVILEPHQYKKDPNGWQIILPDNFYSRGWCERVWSIEWDELPWLKEIPQLKFTSTP